MKLAAIEFGRGRPLVILHGLFGSSRNWGSIGRRLGETCHVLALDLRNHGESPWADGMNYAELAGDVGEFIAASRLDRPVVIGHSLGGKAAMVLALDRPEAVGGVVVVDIAPVAYSHTRLDEVQAMQAVDPAGLRRRAEADALLRPGVPDAAVRGFLLQNLVGGDGGGLRWRINLDAIAAGIEAMAGFPACPEGTRYDGPCLFLSGAESRYVRPEHHAEIERLFPAAHCAEIAGAGHWVHADQPERFVEAVRRFVAGAAA